LFDYSMDFKNTDFREHPELYRIGKGEQGVNPRPGCDLFAAPESRDFPQVSAHVWP
jgi:hypothetical protein